MTDLVTLEIGLSTWRIDLTGYPVLPTRGLISNKV